MQEGATIDRQRGAAERPTAARIKEVHTRFLYPFSFDRRRCDSFVKLLEKQLFASAPVWESFDSSTLAHQYYRSEATPGALASLFGPKGSPRYLRMSPLAGNTMFPHRLVMRHKNTALPFEFHGKAPAEVFLSPFGAGVLCLTMRLDIGRMATAAFGGRSCEAADAAIFNYRMSKLQEWSAPAVRVTHPRDHEQLWSQIPESARKEIPEPPGPSASLDTRLSTAGGEYRLLELIRDLLLAPAAAELQLRPYQEQLAVYTVVRFSEEAVLSDPAVSPGMEILLSALSQVEEHSHAGSAPGQPGVPHELLNANHWAAVGCLGAAHLVVDQGPEVAFNEERSLRARDRYFTGFIAAYVQRLTIRRAADTIGESMESVRSAEGSSGSQLAVCAPQFNLVMKDMIQFNAVEYLPEISYRQVLNRYYRLAQNGLQVPEVWARTHRSIADLDAACRTEYEASLLEGQSHDLRVSKELQAKVEWVEVLLIGIYVAELIHVIGESFGFAHGYTGVSLLAGSFGAIFLAYKILDPRHHVRLKNLPLAVAIGIAALALFIVLGFRVFKAVEEAAAH